MRVEPVGHNLYVRVRATKLLAELLRREPFVIVRRSGALLLVQQSAERGLLVRAAPQQQQHPPDWLAVGRGALIVFRPRQRMRIVSQRGKRGFIHRPGNPRPRTILRRRKSRQGNEQGSGQGKSLEHVALCSSLVQGFFNPGIVNLFRRIALRKNRNGVGS
jgi:hypothetical protein